MQYAQIADRNKNNIINALDYANLANNHFSDSLNTINLVCPHCGKPVIFRQGKHTRPHFSHLASTDRKKTAIQPESAIHRQSKQVIHQIFKNTGINAIAEARIAGGVRRADILVIQPQTSAAMAIEVQYSLITHKEITSREADYAQHDIAVMWLLGAQAKPYRFSSAHLTRLLPFLKIHPELGFYLPYWDERKRQVWIRQLDWFATIKKQITLPIIDYYSLYEKNTVTLAAILTAAEPQMLPKTKLMTDLDCHLQKIMRQPNKCEFKLLDQLRINMLGLTQLPHQVFYYQQHCLFVEEPLWIIIAHYLVIIYAAPDMSPELKIKKLLKLLTKRLNNIISDDLILSWLKLLFAALKLEEWIFSGMNDS